MTIAMIERMPGWLPPLLLLLAAACGKEQSNQAENSAAFDTVKLPLYSGYTAVSVTHSVKDFSAWLEVYSNVSTPESRISVYASPDDPNLVTVFELTKSHKDAKNAFDSERLKKIMRDAGVTSDPIYHYFDVKYRATTRTEKVYRLGVTHAVSNYETWRKAFDEDEPIHREAGLELRAISTNAGDPGMVNVLFATNDIDQAKNLINSEELRKKMSAAGVRSEPAFTVLKVPDLKGPASQ
jgi:hypothetical protein